MAQALILSRPLDGLRRNFARVKARAEALWRAYPRETAAFGLLGLIAAAAPADSSGVEWAEPAIAAAVITPSTPSPTVSRG